MDGAGNHPVYNAGRRDGNAGQQNHIYGARVTLTPHIEGGTWIYDEEYLSRDGNTFKGLKPGRTQVTYTVGWANNTVDITIKESGLPNTGQNFIWVYLLLAAAAAAVIAAFYIRTCRSKAS